MTDFDPFDYEFHARPAETYAWLRRTSPVHFNSARRLWTLSRYRDVQAALRDHTTFASGEGTSIEADAEMAVYLPAAGNIVDLDPPRHDVLRGTIRSYFAPKAIAALENRVRDVARDRLADLRRRGGGDLVADFAQRIPLEIISDVIGIPSEDQGRMVNWAWEMHDRLPGDDRMTEGGRVAAGRLRERFEALIEERRRRPQDDLITHLTREAIDGHPLADDEILALVYLVFLAGHDTTTQLIAQSLIYLAGHPSARKALAAEPNRIPRAVEEFLRFISPIAMMARSTTRETTVSGQVLPTGSRVLLLFGSANRDESEFQRPDEVDLDRSIRRHLAFGEGIHHCIGAPLARLEGRVALEEFLSAFPLYSLVGDPAMGHFTLHHAVQSQLVRV